MANVNLFSGIRAFRVAAQFQSGRRAFVAKKYEQALKHFQKAAQANPDYIFVSGNFRRSVWTFIGRAWYCLGQFAKARPSLEHALRANEDEHLARLCLGLTLIQQSDHSNGRREIRIGLEGLGESIEQTNSKSPSAALWDPQREIRGAIETALRRLDNKQIDSQELIGSADSIVQRFDDEIDHVRRDETRRLNNET